MFVKTREQNTRKLIISLNLKCSTISFRQGLPFTGLCNKDGGRGLISVEGCVNQARISLENFVQLSEEKLLKTMREGVESQETAAGFKARRRAENIQEWKEKPLYGQFVRQGENQRSEETWTWLKEGKLKRDLAGP